MSNAMKTLSSPPSLSTDSETNTPLSTGHGERQIQAAIHSLSTILSTIPYSLLSSQDLPTALLHHPLISSQISTLLRQQDSGAGDNNLCRWFYDTFQSSHPDLQLLVLSFIPSISGLYLSRISLQKPQAGFEAILLALYASETTGRAGQFVTVNIPDLSHPSIYHESKELPKNNATELNMAVISPSLEPHGMVRSTRRARIVGVALELYFTKISYMPINSKIHFCEFCVVWCGVTMNTGVDGETSQNNGNFKGSSSGEVKQEGRIPLPWELLHPILRILGHCLFGHYKDKELIDAATAACRSLHTRSLHDIDSRAILATRSLLRLIEMKSDPDNDVVDHTETVRTNVISL